MTTWRPGPDPWLAPIADTLVCDTKHEHEIHVVTDGRTAYAWSPGGTDSPHIERTGGRLRVECGQPLASDEACTGEVVFDLTEGRVATVEQVGWLREYGAPIEVDVA